MATSCKESVEQRAHRFVYLGCTLQQAVALAGLLVSDVGDGVLVHWVERHKLALLEAIPQTLLACISPPPPISKASTFLKTYIVFLKLYC